MPRSSTSFLGLSLALLASLIGAVQAQPVPTPTPTPPNRPAVVHVRLINMCEGWDDRFDLINLSAPAETFPRGDSQNYFALYHQLSSPIANLAIAKAGTREPLRAFPIAAKRDSFLTFYLSRAKDGKTLQMDLVDDTLEGAEAPRAVYIRNFLTGSDAEVTIANRPADARKVGSGASATISALPRGPVEMQVAALFPDGRPRYSAVGADFTKVQRATILVFRNREGKLRARLIEDGRLFDKG